jgi:hypothetical protein
MNQPTTSSTGRLKARPHREAVSAREVLTGTEDFSEGSLIYASTIFSGIAALAALRRGR